MNSTLKKLLIAAVLIIAALGIYTLIKPGWFMDLGMKMTASAKHRDAATEKAAFTLSSAALSEAFQKDVTAASTTYINKAIEVTGNITAIEENRVSLDNVICTIDSAHVPKLATLKVGDAVKIQGRLSTFNDLMGEIVMDQCVVK